MTLGEFALACEKESPEGWRLVVARADGDIFYADFAVEGAKEQASISVPAYSPDVIAAEMKAALGKHTVEVVDVGQELRLRGTELFGTITSKDDKMLTVAVEIPAETADAWERKPVAVAVEPVEAQPVLSIK